MKIKNKYAILFLFILIAFNSCFHYIKYSFNIKIQPEENPNKLGTIHLLVPYLYYFNSDDQDINIDDYRIDLFEEGFELLNDLSIAKVIRETIPYTIVLDKKKQNIIDFDNIEFNKKWFNRGNYLFIFVYFEPVENEGYVYKKVWDPNYNAYYYKEVYEKKMVYTMNMQVFLYDADKNHVKFRKDFSNSEEYSQDIPMDIDFIKDNFDDFLKEAFNSYLPSEKKVMRYLIGR